MKDKLNEIYESILGKGDPIDRAEDEPAQNAESAVNATEDKKTVRPKYDAAYAPEDYSDDAEDGVDPREPKSDDAEQEEPSDEDGGPQEEDIDTAQEEPPADDDGEIIDERLVRAGRRARLSDEAIIELAEQRPEVLEALAAAQEAAEQAIVERTARIDDSKEKSEQEPEKTDDILDLDDEEFESLSPKAKSAILKLNERINAISQELDTQKNGLTQIQKEAQQRAIRRIDEFFDAASEDIPALGKAATLTQQQADVRRYIAKIARGAQMAFDGALSDEEALAIGINAYKGQMSEHQLKAKLAADLNRNKKRFTPRYRGRRISETKSADERAMDAINRILDDPKYG